MVSWGHHIEAIESLNMTLRLNPASAEAFYQRGRAHLRQNAHAQALQDFNQALALKPDEATRGSSLYQRGLIYARQGEYQAAIDDIHQRARR